LRVPRAICYDACEHAPALFPVGISPAMHVGPLTFVEIFKSKPWGGRALARTSAKRLPSGGPIGECWELADHPHGTSIVDAGPLHGVSLAELVRHHAAALLGPGRRDKRFPLLIKLLDCRERLSVQVHPDDACARRMGLRDSGKTEAWYVIEARSNGSIIAGLRSRRIIPRLPGLATSGSLGEHLRALRPESGEAWLCPAGTIHALGPGLVLLEIQQNSDATFRLYDWGRVGLDGRPRPLHIEESLEAIGGRARSLRRARPRRLSSLPFPAERLIRCDKFVVDRWRLRRRATRVGTGGFEVLHVVSGAGEVRAPEWPALPLRRGRTFLVPACVRRYEISPSRPLLLIRAAEPR